MNSFTFGKQKQVELKQQLKGNQASAIGNIEYIELVEKCSQIIRDDKNILRQLIKDGNSQVIAIIKTKKKAIDQMQAELKRFLKQIKSSSPRGEELTLSQRQQNQNESFMSQPNTELNGQNVREQQKQRNPTNQSISPTHQNMKAANQNINIIQPNLNAAQQNINASTNFNQQKLTNGVRPSQDAIQITQQYQMLNINSPQTSPIPLYKVVSLVPNNQGQSPQNIKPRSLSEQALLNDAFKIPSVATDLNSLQVHQTRINKTTSLHKNFEPINNYQISPSQRNRNESTQGSTTPQQKPENQKTISTPKNGYHLAIKKQSLNNIGQIRQNGSGKSNYKNETSKNSSGFPSRDKLDTSTDNNAQIISKQERNDSSIQQQQQQQQKHLYQQQQQQQQQLQSTIPHLQIQAQPNTNINKSTSAYNQQNINQQRISPNKIVTNNIDSSANNDNINRIETIYLNSEQNCLPSPQLANSNEFLQKSDQIKADNYSSLIHENTIYPFEGNSLDQQLNLQTIESANLNPQKNSNNITITQQGITPNNFQRVNQNNGITDSLEKKMFTFESPHKQMANVQPQSHLFSTDGKVRIADFYSPQQVTPTKQSQNQRNSQNSNNQPENIDNQLIQLVNTEIKQENTNDINNLTTTDKKQTQISTPTQEYSGWKYQSPLENKYGQQPSDGGISPVILKNKFEAKNNVIGEAYSYNGSEVKQQFQQSSGKQEDQYESTQHNFLFEDPIKESINDFNCSKKVNQLNPVNDIQKGDESINTHLLSNNRIQYSQSFANAALTQNSNSQDQHNSIMKESKRLLESFHNNQTQNFDLNNKRSSTSFHEQPFKLAANDDILQTITQKLAKLSSPQNALTKKATLNLNNPSQNLSNSTNQGDYGTLGSSRGPTSSNQFCKNNDLYSSQYSTLKAPTINDSNYLGSVIGQTNAIEKQYNYSNFESSLQSLSSFRENYSQPSTQREELKYSTIQQDKPQNNQFTYFKSKNGEIESTNKTEYGFNAKQPYQFTYVNSEIPKYEIGNNNQHASSFSYDPVNQNKNSFISPYISSYSFVQMPNYQNSTTSFTAIPPLQTQNSLQNNNINNNSNKQINNYSSSYLHPATKIQLNPGIQEILDRYIPKSSPTIQAIQTEYSQSQIAHQSIPQEQQSSYLPQQVDRFEYIPKSTPTIQIGYCQSQIEQQIGQQISHTKMQYSQQQDDVFDRIIKSSRQEKDSTCQNNNKSNCILNNDRLTSQKSPESNKHSQNNQLQDIFYSFQDNDSNNQSMNFAALNAKPPQDTNEQHCLLPYKQPNSEKEQSDIFQRDSFATSTAQNSKPSQDFTKKDNSTSLVELHHESDKSEQNNESMSTNSPYFKQSQAQSKICTINVATILNAPLASNSQLAQTQNIYTSNQQIPSLTVTSCGQLSQTNLERNLNVLSPGTLFSFPSLRHHLTKYTCEQVLEELFDHFSLSLTILTKEYFIYKMQYVPHISSMSLITREISALFEASDINQDWKLDINELGQSMQQLCKASQQDEPLRILYRSIDLQNEGQITLIDFLNFASARGYDQVVFTKQNLKQISLKIMSNILNLKLQQQSFQKA